MDTSDKLLGGGIVVCFCFFIATILAFGWMFSPLAFEYREQFKSHTCAACEMQAPDYFIGEVKLAINGIEALKLAPEDFTTILPWKKNYRNTVSFEINKMNSFIDKAQRIIEWRESAYSNSTIKAGETIEDLYREKINNLHTDFTREFEQPIRAGLQAKYAPIYALSGIFIFLGLVTLLLVLTGGVFTCE